MGRRIGTYIVAATVGTFAAGQAWAQSTTSSSQPQDPQTITQSSDKRDEARSRQALVQARETLAEITKMPEASQLQGQARTEVSQLINNFNSLLGAEANWYEHYQTVMQNVHNIIGPPTSDEATSATAGTSGSSTTGSTSGTTGSTGSTGTAAGSAAGAAEVPSAIRNKLSAFRQQLMEFGRAAGAPDPMGGVSATGTSGSTMGSTGGTTGSTSGTAGSTTGSTTGTTSGTTGSATGSTTGSTSTYGSTGSTTGSETVQEHVDAINDILQQAMGGASSSTAGTTGSTGATTGSTGSTTGSTGSTSGSMSGSSSVTGSVTLTREQVDKIQSHLQRIREISRQQNPVR